MSDSTGITRVIPVANQAGSVGKTTTTVTLAALLAQAGHQVLVIDLDGQANATAWLGVDPETRPAGIGDVLLRRTTLPEATTETNTAGVRLVPATPALDAHAVELARLTGGEQRLRQALRTAKGVDVVLIDCPGSISVLTVAALVAATTVVTVTAPSSKELSGIPRLEGTIQDVADAYNEDLTLGAIVPCIVPAASSGQLYRDALDLLTTTYNGLVTPTVRRSVRAPEAMSHATPLPIHAPGHGITADYRAVLAHLQAAGVLP